MMDRFQLFENFLILDNIELLQKFLKIQKLEKGYISFLYRMCHKHGWATFSGDVISKIGKLKSYLRFVNLEKFINYEDNNDPEKQIIVHSIKNEMITKFEYEMEHPPRKSWYRIDIRLDL